ncbi:MAG TPA: VWA domain-containing protein [Casimicrobiaceae bacterium]|nr:VWA domain-containing protein [Casimicrobiaceae bacterium]
MTFLWPEALPLLLAVPALVAAYVWLLRRRKRFAVRHPSLGLVREALARRPIRQHIPPALFLIATTCALLAAARPTAQITLPSEQRVIMLAIDVSLSMRARDVQPNRMVAAQEAAKAFVQGQPPDVLVGIVTFAGSANLVQSPTRDRDALVAAIDGFRMQMHTAIGSGLILSLATLFPDDGLTLEHNLPGVNPRGSGRYEGTKDPAAVAKGPQKPAFKPVPPGSNTHKAIILLTDGRRTIGPDSLEAARMAADRGIRVYTVGFGTAGGAPAEIDGYSVYMRFDEEVLKGIAGLTRADYFHASSAAELKRVYEALNAEIVLTRRNTEISALLAAAAGLLAVTAGALSVVWFGRLA